MFRKCISWTIAIILIIIAFTGIVLTKDAADQAKEKSNIYNPLGTSCDDFKKQ